MEKRFVYADNAATTKISRPVMDVLIPALDLYGNPSSLYELGDESKMALENARAQCAKAIGAAPAEVFFTSGGSEADNWALKGAAAMLQKKGKNFYRV